MLVENAWIWGNDCDLDKPVEITVYFSRKGFLIQVKDEGKGFNVKQVLDDKNRGLRFYRNGGSAFTAMDNDKKHLYSYNEKGNEAYMLCLAEREPALTQK